MTKRLKRWALATSIVAGLVFVLAGTLRDVWLWAYVGVWAAASAYALLGMDEELAKERSGNFLNLVEEFAVAAEPLTENGIHLNVD